MHYTEYMTHEELLARISIVGDTSLDTALCAVVELHTEQEVTLPDGEWGILCGHCSEYGVYVLYPCKTIRAIEKELGYV
jgi:hypothetical protein